MTYEKSEIGLRKCTNEELKKELSACPEIIEELIKLSDVSSGDWIDLYDLLLYKHGMSFGIDPVYKGKNDIILYFAYHFWIDGEKTQILECRGIKTFANAQLQVVHDTMYRLRERLLPTTSIPRPKNTGLSLNYLKC